MAVSRQRRNVAYGVGQPLQDMSPQPISSTRAPTTSDSAELGTIWVRKSTNQSWVLASIVSNSATWTPTTVNAGATIDTGSLTVTVGDINITAGDLEVDAGDITVSAGDIFVLAGSIGAALDVSGRSLFAQGDEGTGTVAEVAITNVVDETLSTGAGKVLMKTANPQDSSGWLKIYSGTDIRYIPYWTTLSP